MRKNIHFFRKISGGRASYHAARRPLLSDHVTDRHTGLWLILGCLFSSFTSFMQRIADRLFSWYQFTM